MSSEYENRKGRRLEQLLQAINENPDVFRDLDSPSERRGGRQADDDDSWWNAIEGYLPTLTETERAAKAGFYDGFTFGAGDELDAAFAAVPAWFDDRDAGDIYDAELARARAEAEYLQSQHPIAFGAGAVAGSFAQPANYTGAGWAARGAGLLGTAARAAVLGAGNGAIHGFAGGEGGLDARLRAASRGAATGATIGAVAGIPLRGYATGRELSLGSNFRLAPFGNRTSHPLGRWPHYHRRGPMGPNGQTVEGQGIGRHRPWETKKRGKGKKPEGFWDRF